MPAILTLSNTAAQFFNPARAAIMRVIIPHDRRVEASSSAMFALTGVAMAATALGPITFAILGPAVAISVRIVAYLLSLTMTCLVDTPPALAADRPPQERFWSEFAGGLRLAWSSPRLRAVVIGVVLYGISLGINNTSLGLYGLKTLGLSAKQYGLLSMMFPAGNLLAAVIGVRWVKKAGVHRLYVLSLAALGSSYILLGLCRVTIVALISMFVCGLVFSVYIMCQGPILQEATPIGYMGRISAITSPATAISSAAGTVVASQALGLMISRKGSPHGSTIHLYGDAIAIGAVFMLIGGLIMFAAQRTSQMEDPAPRIAVSTET